MVAAAASVFGRTVGLATQHAPDRRQQQLGHLMFGEVPVGAGRKGATNIERGIVCAQHQDPQTQMTGTDISHQFQTIAVDERKICDHEVGPRDGDRDQPFLQGSGFRADDEIRLGIDQRGKPAPYQWMIVDDEDPPPVMP